MLSEVAKVKQKQSARAAPPCCEAIAGVEPKAAFKRQIFERDGAARQD
jgi:hypothetical protein